MSEAARAMSVSDDTVDAVKLRALTKIKRNADLERYLTKQRIPWFPGKDGPWTTLRLIEDAGLVQIGMTPANSTDSKEPTQWLK